MKYIDSEKLVAEIEKRIADGQDGYGGNLKALIPVITSLQKEQSENKQSIFYDMFSPIIMRKEPKKSSAIKHEQKCIFGNTPSEEACKYCGVVCGSRVPKVITSTSTKVSPSPKEVADKDEQIGLSIMAYLDSNIKSDKHKVCGVPLKTAREWIRKMIAYSQEQPEMDLEKEIDRFLSNTTPIKKGVYEISRLGFKAVARHFYELGGSIQYQQDRAEFAKLKAKEWQSGYDEGYAKGINAKNGE